MTPPRTVALTGASGWIGRSLTTALADGGAVIRKLGRRAAPPDGWAWDALAGPPPAAALDGTTAVVHLSGEPIAQRWSTDAWRRIVDSRVAGTRRLVDTLIALERKPAVLVSASAIGIYGDRGNESLSENSPAGSGRVAHLCTAWEREALRAEEAGIRVVLLRTGLVLGADGGALARMLPAFRLGLGGRLADGCHWMSWIHHDDLVRLILFALDRDELRGPLNATAPAPVTNREFTRMLGAVLRRPAVLPMPRLALRLLFGEMAAILTVSQRVLPEAALHHGFEFRYSALAAALTALLGRDPGGSG